MTTIPHSLARRMRVLATLAIAIVTTIAAACDRTGGGVTVKGDSPDLEQAARRADSMIAEISKPAVFDTMKFALALDSAVRSGDTTPAPGGDATRAAVAPGRLDPSLPRVSIPGDNPMSRRAQARGDSMARAAAQRFAPRSGGTSRSRGDSVRGVVTLTGSSAARQTVLKASDGSMVAMSGMATSGLARMEGAEIVVRGVKVTPRDVVVSEYIVRRVAGVPAWDGRLEDADGALSIVLTDGTGRKRILGDSPTLRALVGTRVWISMEDGQPPTAFGMLGRR